MNAEIKFSCFRNYSILSASFWTVEEVDLSKDMVDWERLKVQSHRKEGGGISLVGQTLYSAEKESAVWEPA